MTPDEHIILNLMNLCYRLARHAEYVGIGDGYSVHRQAMIELTSIARQKNIIWDLRTGIYVFQEHEPNCEPKSYSVELDQEADAAILWKEIRKLRDRIEKIEKNGGLNVPI